MVSDLNDLQLTGLNPHCEGREVWNPAYKGLVRRAAGLQLNGTQQVPQNTHDILTSFAVHAVNSTGQFINPACAFVRVCQPLRQHKSPAPGRAPTNWDCRHHGFVASSCFRSFSVYTSRWRSHGFPRFDCSSGPGGKGSKGTPQPSDQPSGPPPSVGVARSHRSGVGQLRGGAWASAWSGSPKGKGQGHALQCRAL